MDYFNRTLMMFVLAGIYCILLLWWLALHLSGASSDAMLLWGSVYQVIAWFGALAGIIISQQWGGIHSLMGRATLAFALGLLCQAFGQTAYAWYVFHLKIEIPYPSIGDVGYFISIFFYMYGALMLAKVSGAKASLMLYHNRMQAAILPLGLLVVSYFIFLKGYEFDWTQPLKILLDFGYPFGQAIYVSIAILAYSLTRNVLGGIMRRPMQVLIGALLAQYLCDFTFLYQASKGTFYAGGPNDLMYATSYAIMAWALLNIGRVYSHIKAT